MFSTPESQLISLTSNSSTVSRAFPSSVRNTAGPCFFASISVNVCQILISFNHASYDTLFSKDGGALKFVAIISESFVPLLPCKIFKIYYWVLTL